MSGRCAPYSCKSSGAWFGGVPADINSSRRCLSAHWGSNWTWGRSCVWRSCTQGPGVQLTSLSRPPRFWRLLLVLGVRWCLAGASFLAWGVTLTFFLSSTILCSGPWRAGGLQRRCCCSWALWHFPGRVWRLHTVPGSTARFRGPLYGFWRLLLPCGGTYNVSGGARTLYRLCSGTGAVTGRSWGCLLRWWRLVCHCSSFSSCWGRR